jgi:hypothetical protein
MKKETYEELQRLSPIAEAEKYLDLLDKLEQEELLEKQTRRREIVLEKSKQYE